MEAYVNILEHIAKNKWGSSSVFSTSMRVTESGDTPETRTAHAAILNIMSRHTSLIENPPTPSVQEIEDVRD